MDVSIRGISTISSLRAGIERAAGDLPAALAPSLPAVVLRLRGCRRAGGGKARNGPCRCRRARIANVRGSGVGGKTHASRRMTTDPAPIDPHTQQDSLRIHSVARAPVDGLLAGRRPFRSPHHSISAAGLVGGGRPVGPGEVSLAHGGVLFLDRWLTVSLGRPPMLRQPIERGSSTSCARRDRSSFPAASACRREQSLSVRKSRRP